MRFNVLFNAEPVTPEQRVPLVFLKSTQVRGSLCFVDGHVETPNNRGTCPRSRSRTGRSQIVSWSLTPASLECTSVWRGRDLCLQPYYLPADSGKCGVRQLLAHFQPQFPPVQNEIRLSVSCLLGTVGGCRKTSWALTWK